MSTDLYHIKVLEKKGLEVRLRVTIVYDDIQRTPSSSATEFFLLVLLDEAYSYSSSEPNAPIGEAISMEESGDWDFRRKYSHRYISEVVEVESANQLADIKSNSARPAGAGRNYDTLPATDYLVSVTEAQWIAHLEPGDAWGTTAFEGRGY